jgi:hypothetical protein
MMLIPLDVLVILNAHRGQGLPPPNLKCGCWRVESWRREKGLVQEVLSSLPNIWMSNFSTSGEEHAGMADSIQNTSVSKQTSPSHTNKQFCHWLSVL